ncbi:MAG: hypothetical protein VB108_10090 [Anaerolineaceae bacterium]|nr:hypothetical protein [Anaerolineaceae bacterium]
MFPEKTAPVDLFAEKKAPFILGKSLDPEINLPLGRFLPPFYKGQVSEWVGHYVPPGSWVLDPFGQDPFADLELARSGYRVLVSANNPIAAFLLEALSLGAAEDEWAEALELIGKIPMPARQNFKTWLEELYSLPCPNQKQGLKGQMESCGQKAQVQRFLWSGDNASPSSAELYCPSCEALFQVDLSAQDNITLTRLPSFALYRARALELLSGPQDELRPIMEDLIQYYTPRALVLLQMLLNKLETDALPNRVRTLTRALFLSAADRMNVLWAFPLGKNRPKQLTTPPTYEELNLWKALEQACKQWQAFSKKIELRHWPDMPSRAGGISLFSGRLRELNPLPKQGMIDLVYASLPRRNQAWWNLSGLWTGWLWGKNALEPLRHSLIRQRYDWNWHATALQKVLGQLPSFIQPQSPILFQISELDSKFLLSALLAASKSKLKIRAFAASGNCEQLQLVLRKGQNEKEIPISKAYWPEAVRAAANKFLTTRSEPSAYLPLLTAICLFLQDQGILDSMQPSNSPNLLSDIEKSVQEVLADSARFERFNPGSGFETGTFWLRQSPPHLNPLADRTEAAVMQEIYQNHSFTLPELLAAVYRKTRGLNNPELDLTAAILQSYAEPLNEAKQEWQLREGESLTDRAEDLRQMMALITNLASKLKYDREIGPEYVIWFDPEGKAVYKFFPTTNAIITPLLLSHTNDTSTKLIVIPGSRANLLAFKLKHDPNLQRMLTQDWQIIKFRQLRQLAENPLLTQQLFASQLLSDPPEYHTIQLKLL